MSKKKSLLLVLGVEALIYLFLLVGVPAFAEAFICDTCNARELFPTPLVVYFTPGLIGLIFVLLIWKQKGEIQDE